MIIEDFSSRAGRDGIFINRNGFPFKVSLEPQKFLSQKSPTDPFVIFKSMFGPFRQIWQSPLAPLKIKHPLSAKPLSLVLCFLVTRAFSLIIFIY